MKKKVEITKNISSGAEKVEAISQEPETKKVGETAKNEKKVQVKKAEKEKHAEKERVEKALKKQRKKEEKKAAALKRKEALQAKRKAFLEKLHAEEKRLEERREKRRRERAHKKANARQKKLRKRNETGKSRQSNGGWIAAVVALGVTSLALGGTVVAGAVDMNRNSRYAMNGHKSNFYELTGIMENVEKDLDRIRISDSPSQQSRILTDLLVQARLAEADLEKLPISAREDENISSFLNRTAACCERMLSKLRNGEKLSQKDSEMLAHLYEVNHSVREELSGLVSSMQDSDFKDFLKKGKGKISEAMEKIEKMTMEENRLAFAEESGKDGAGMDSTSLEDKSSHIQPAQAEELCKRYFSDYKIEDYQCIGETVSKGYSAYNVQGYDSNGTLLFAEIDQKSGELLRFDYYEDCVEEKFDLDRAEDIAEEFLERLGYEDLEVVRVRHNGTTADFSFVYEMEDVVYYPDEILIKVCQSRGVVTGMDATKYLQNHKGRVEMNPKINMEEAYEKLHKDLSVEASRLAVVQTERGEKLAYEFLCNYQEGQYLVYLDAENGEEISIVNTENLR